MSDKERKEPQREAEVNQEGSWTSGSSVTTNDDGSQHVSTFVHDEDTGMGLRVSYDTDSEGNFSDAHFTNQSEDRYKES